MTTRTENRTARRLFTIELPGPLRLETEADVVRYRGATFLVWRFSETGEPLKVEAAAAA